MSEPFFKAADFAGLGPETSRAAAQVANAKRDTEMGQLRESEKFERKIRETIQDECDRLRVMLKCAHELIRHAVALEHFTPGGSTAGWARDVLTEIEASKLLD